MSTSCSGNGMAFFPANFMLQQPHHNNDTTHQQHHPPCSTPTCLSSLLPSCSPAHHEDHFHGGAGIEIAPGLGKRSMSFSAAGLEYDQHHEEHHHNLIVAGAAGNHGGDEDLSDDGSVQLGGGVSGEKKRRLNMEQVRTLERNFELGNKLEPERKMQLSKALGLQPRQVAIWFQNRRARWKTKQLEKDYDALKRQFDALKSENDALLSQNQKLQAEIMKLKNNNNNSYKEPTESINLNKENTEGSSSNRSENSSHEIIKLDMISSTPPPPPAAAAAPYFDDHQQHCHSPLSAAAPIPAHHHHHHQTPSMPLFPPSSNSSSAAGLVVPIVNRHLNAASPHLHFHGHIASAHEELRNHPHESAPPSVLPVVKEENNNSNSSFSNMFVGIDDQPGFWPWLEQHNFN